MLYDSIKIYNLTKKCVRIYGLFSYFFHDSPTFFDGHLAYIYRVDHFNPSSRISRKSNPGEKNFSDKSC